MEKSWGQSRIPQIPDEGIGGEGSGRPGTISNKIKPEGIRVIPPSPQAQIFDRYLNHTIQESSGLPDINIPLYEIRLKEITIPITLSYNASGIKHGQFDGEVGAGWSINSTGYRISRTINGRPDEKFDFYQEKDFKEYVLGNKSVYELNAYLARLNFDTRGSGDGFEVLTNGGFGWDDRIEGEYDIFSYTLPTTQGRFILSDRKSKSFTNLGINLDRITSNSSLSFIMEDANGVGYLIGGYSENGNALYESDNNLNITSWLLNSIVTPNSESINFDYQDIKTNMDIPEYDAAIIRDYPRNSMGIKDNYINYPSADLNPVKRSYYDKVPFITKIETAYEDVAFERYQDSYLLKEVSIRSKASEIIKTITFYYTKSGSCNLLNKIEVKGGGKGIEVHSFDYYSGTAGSPDQWGYYSNIIKSKSNSAWKDIDLHNTFLEDRIRINPLHGNTQPLKEIRNLNSDFDRSFLDRTNKDKIVPHIYSLKTIYFPTGGKTIYKYESNQYLDNGVVMYGGGLRVGQITSYTNEDTITTTYKYGKDENGNGKINFNKGIKSDYFANERVSYQRHMYGGGVSYFTDQKIITYSTKPIISEFLDFSVNYDYITKYQVNTKDKLSVGKTISQYDIPIKYYLGLTNLVHTNHGREQVDSYNWGASPTLISKKYYDNKDCLLKSEIYNYKDEKIVNIEGVKVYQPIVSDTYVKKMRPTEDDVYSFEPFLFSFLKYNLSSTIKLLESKSTILYHKESKDSICSIESYEYDSKNQLKRISLNKTLINQLNYPYDYTDKISKSMVSSNVLKPVVENIVTKNNKEVFRKKNSFMEVYTGKLNPTFPYIDFFLSKVESSTTGTSGLKAEVTYDLYDNLGNLLQKTNKDGVVTSYIWSYNGQYPVAEVVNANYDQIKAILEVTPESISSSLSPDMTKINPLREKLPEAQVTTYKYKPLVGMIEKTNPRGVTTYYDYDFFGRLKETYIKENGQKRIIESYNYHYQNQ